MVSESSAEKGDPESEAPDAAMPESLKKSKDAAAKREQAEQVSFPLKISPHLCFQLEYFLVS